MRATRCLACPRMAADYGVRGSEGCLAAAAAVGGTIQGKWFSGVSSGRRCPLTSPIEASAHRERQFESRLPLWRNSDQPLAWAYTLPFTSRGQCKIGISLRSAVDTRYIWGIEFKKLSASCQVAAMREHSSVSPPSCSAKSAMPCQRLYYTTTGLIFRPSGAASRPVKSAYNAPSIIQYLGVLNTTSSLYPPKK